jgi:hypothetical protein
VGDGCVEGIHCMVASCHDVATQELLTPLLHRHPHVTQDAATSFLAGAALMHQRPQLPQAAATS